MKQVSQNNEEQKEVSEERKEVIVERKEEEEADPYLKAYAQ